MRFVHHPARGSCSQINRFFFIIYLFTDQQEKLFKTNFIEKLFRKVQREK